MGDVRHNTGPQVKQENLKQEPTPPSAMSEAPNQRSHTVASPEPFDEYGGDEFEELGIFGADDTVFDDLMPDEATADYTTIETPSKPPRPNSGLGQGANQMNTFNRNNNGQPPQQQRQSPTKQPQRPPTRQYPPPPPISAPLRPQPMPSGPQGQTPRPQSRPTPRLQGQPGPQGPNSRPNQPSGPPRPDSAGPVNAPPKQQPVPQLQSHPSGNHNNTNHNNNNNNPTNPTTTPAQPPQPHNPPIGFYTGRAAMSLKFDTDTIPEQAAAFDPRRPTTIPRSAGIDHSKSSPVPRKTVQGVQAYSPPGFQMPGMNRQIGMPPGRAQFRAPGLSAGTKRPAESHIPQTK